MPRRKDPRTKYKYRKWAKRIKRERIWCERCKKKGVLVDCYNGVGDLHHIKELSKGGRLMDPKNVELLCKPCHFKHHYGKSPPKKKRGIHELATADE